MRVKVAPTNSFVKEIIFFGAGPVFGHLATHVVSATAQGDALRATSATIDLRVALFSTLLTVPRRHGRRPVAGAERGQ
jgi:hypothetical protein